MKPLAAVIALFALLTVVALSMAGIVCLGSWIDGSGGCPAKMPWEGRGGVT